MSQSQKQQDPTSVRMDICGMCQGAGIIPVRCINGAYGLVTVFKGGVPETIVRTETAQVRCPCDRGNRFEKTFKRVFDDRWCVSLLPGGEKRAAEANVALQQPLPF